jgi:hypothetical protein
MATSYNLNVTKGQGISIRLNAKDDDGLPLNLSGYSISGHAREKYSSSGILLDLNPSVVIGFEASGYVDINVLSSSTINLPVTQAVYDVEMHSGINVTRLIEGYLNIYPEVTR